MADNAAARALPVILDSSDVRSEAKIKTRWIVCAAVAAALMAATAQAQNASTPDPWTGVRFLIGTWSAKTTGGAAKAESTGEYSFALELGGHLLARHSSGSGCKGPNDFNCDHHDQLYIYPEGGALKAIYFDNEGHVLHYEVTIPKPESVVLTSDSITPGPKFCLTYNLADGVMTGKFQLRMPGQQEFSSYLEWSGKRQ